MGHGIDQTDRTPFCGLLQGLQSVRKLPNKFSSTLRAKSRLRDIGTS